MFLFILAAAAIRDASSSMEKLEQCKKISITATTEKTERQQTDTDNKKSKEKRLERYRPALFYDDDDENTSNPKLEKIINEDKERIEREQKKLLDKKKANKDVSRDVNTKNKMESSADKFKQFLQDDVADLSESSNTKAQDNNGDNDDAKCDLTASVSPQVSGLEPSDSSTPPAWKKKRQSTSHSECSGSKRSRKSASAERDDIPEVKHAEILQGIVFVISGIQVRINS